MPPIPPGFDHKLRTALDDIETFAAVCGGLRLRRYQRAVAHAVVDSVLRRLGLTFVVVFPRQSGKNEIQAQIEAYLLTLLCERGAEMVVVSPTWRPQAMNAMRRLEGALRRNLLVRKLAVEKEAGHIFRIGEARLTFLSGAPGANIVGATASTLLQCDEAQDVAVEKWDKEVNPMAASTNATRVFWGTAWTSGTLLGREMRQARLLEGRDGVKRLFTLDADQVAAEVPAYGRFVASEIAKHGREHPLIKTQYYSETIDDQGGMFPARRLALIQGEHPPQEGPLPDHLYAMTVDVAGQAEFSTTPGSGRQRDATALTIFDIDLSAVDDPLIAKPIYRVVGRRLWQGAAHQAQYAQIKAIAEAWQPQHIVIDATGLGEALAGFLDAAFSGRVMPFKFTRKSKSDLGWAFLAIVETNRFKEYRVPEFAGDEAGRLHRAFLRELAHAQMTVLPGPGKLMRWQVPDGARDSETGELVHDDLLVAAALCARLDAARFGRAVSAVVEAYDPLDDMSF